MKKLSLLFFTIVLCISCKQENGANVGFSSDEMMIRLSEIEIEPEYLDEYLAILQEESRASVKLESGVISIYPMYQQEKPNEIRILEIYADKKAYESHLAMSHFKQYKETTLKMVKSLKLVDMNAIDEQTMPIIFKKIK